MHIIVTSGLWYFIWGSLSYRNKLKTKYFMWTALSINLKRHHLTDIHYGYLLCCEVVRLVESPSYFYILTSPTVCPHDHRQLYKSPFCLKLKDWKKNESLSLIGSGEVDFSCEDVKMEFHWNHSTVIPTEPFYYIIHLILRELSSTSFGSPASVIQGLGFPQKNCLNSGTFK